MRATGVQFFSHPRLFEKGEVHRLQRPRCHLSPGALSINIRSYKPRKSHHSRHFPWNLPHTSHTPRSRKMPWENLSLPHPKL